MAEKASGTNISTNVDSTTDLNQQQPQLQRSQQQALQQQQRRLQTDNHATQTMFNQDQQLQLQLQQQQLQLQQQKQQQQQQQMINSQVLRPKTVLLRRQDGHGFGFTLRHFIVYPPESCTQEPNNVGQLATNGAFNLTQPMDTVFVKEVRPYGPAYYAGLQTGDRLLAVSGMPVAGTPYARVVAAIQQTPSTLTLQVVPKEYDILQTFFGDTAHNPETNQRPKLYSSPGASAVASAAISAAIAIGNSQSHTSGGNNNNQLGRKQQPSDKMFVHTLHQTPEPQHALMKPKNSNSNAENNNKSNNNNNTLLQKQSANKQNRQQIQQSQVIQNNPQLNEPLVIPHLSYDTYDRRESSASVSSSVGSFESGSTLTSELGDSAIMSRLRKSFEQKEEFLKRPNQPIKWMPEISQGVQLGVVPPREFYSRPNRLQKPVWPPPELTGSNTKENITNNDLTTNTTTKASITTNGDDKSTTNNYNNHIDLNTKDITTQRLQQINNNNINNALFIKKGNFVMQTPHQQQHPQNQLIITSTPKLRSLSEENYPERDYLRDLEVIYDSPSTPINLHDNDLEFNKNCGSIPTVGLHIVSERAKQFESGRPLSPDGNYIDRTLLYKSELSRLSTKNPVPNVAVRRREFELIAENSDWRKDNENDRSSSFENTLRGSSRGPSRRARSLSTDSAKDVLSYNNNKNSNIIDEQHSSRDFRRRAASRQNSYLEAVNQSIAYPKQRYEQTILETSTDNTANVNKNNNILNKNKYNINKNNNLTSTNEVNKRAILKELHVTNRNKMILCCDDLDDNIINNNNNNATIINSKNLIKATQLNRTIFFDPTMMLNYNNTDIKKNIDDIEMLNVVQQQHQDQHKQIQLDSSQQQKQQQELPQVKQQHKQSAVRPTTLNLLDIPVVRRQKSIVEDEERATRRASYLRATGNENEFQVDSDYDNSPMSSIPADTPDADESLIIALQPPKSAHRTWRRPRFPTDIQPLRRIFEDSPPQVNLPTAPDTQILQSIKHSHLLLSHGSKGKAINLLRDTPIDPNATILHDGEINVKITTIDGKRSQDRAWRTVWAEIRGNKLKLTIHRDGKSNQSPENSGIIDLRSFQVTEGNYTKRKHVFKLSSIGTTIANSPSTTPTSSTHATSTSNLLGETELLIQTDNQQDMKLWMDTLKTVCGGNNVIINNDSCINRGAKSEEFLNHIGIGNQTAEPQRIAATTTIQTTINDELSPIAQQKTIRKYGLGSRSPSGQSPVTKSRKTPQQTNVFTSQNKESSDKESGSPKSKTWKGLVARQFRKIQGQPLSPGPHSNLMVPPEGGSIGVSLAHCPPSEENEYVPLIVEKCTRIVESKGLNVVGIYRIPGNTAAITALTEQVNRGFDEQTLNDPKWDDVNVVSSLLKLFIRTLPDALIPSEMYNRFINADKLTGAMRLQELKTLLKALPAHYYETLKHLMRHLNRISQNCLVNLMEPRNLAIVFGPSVIHSSTGNLEIAVKDMKHQCQIVEVFVSYYQFFFEDEPIPHITEIENSANDNFSDGQATNLLLDNVSKIESASRERDTSRFVANIVEVAHRKIRRTAHRKSTVSSTTPDTLSLDSSTSAESKDQPKRFGCDSTHQLQQQQQILRRAGINISDKNNHHNSQNVVEGTTKPRSSEEEVNDSAFLDNGSMSLTTVTLTLDKKLRSLRNSAFDSDELIINDNKPLTLGENIPFADESPERPLIPQRSKPMRQNSYGLNKKYDESNTTTSTTTDGGITNSTSSSLQNSPKDSKTASINNSCENLIIKIPPNKGTTIPINNDALTTTVLPETIATATITLPIPPPTTAPILNNEISSDDTDTSTTSTTNNDNIKINRDVLREMNRILTNLERNAIKLNRSLSLNYKNQNKHQQYSHQAHHLPQQHQLQQDNNCCCYNNSNNRSNITYNSRLQILTKDEKTDKNISKKRQLQQQDVKSYRRNYHINGSRSIKRRHTVGGTHDYSQQKIQQNHHHHYDNNLYCLNNDNLVNSNNNIDNVCTSAVDTTATVVISGGNDNSIGFVNLATSGSDSPLLQNTPASVTASAAATVAATPVNLQKENRNANSGNSVK